MAGIARNIELYNSAYGLAWKHISELQKREKPNIASRLHDSIRREIKRGQPNLFSLPRTCLGMSSLIQKPGTNRVVSGGTLFNLDQGQPEASVRRAHHSPDRSESRSKSHFCGSSFFRV